MAGMFKHRSIAGVMIPLLLSMLIYAPASAQRRYNPAGITFYQLNTAHGLSDNYVHDMCMDKNGNLWIGTGEGLNLYNGKSVIRFFASDNPELKNDYVEQLVCDNHNRIWVRNEG